MKKILLISVLCMVSLAGYAPKSNELTIVKEKPIEPFLRLWDAIIVVESNRDATAYNRASKATGCAQITPILLKDYNRRSGKDYTLHDCYSIITSKEIFLFYCSLWPSDYEYIARKWNGSGKETKKYWKRIKSELNKQ